MKFTIFIIKPKMDTTIIFSEYTIYGESILSIDSNKISKATNKRKTPFTNPDKI